MIDLFVVIAFVGYSVFVGFRYRKQASQSPEEYFLAGRSLKGWQAGLSMAATQFAADTPLLVTGLVATAGIFSLWRLWIYALAFLLMGFLFGPMWRRAQVLTDAEYMELRYGGAGALILRMLKAIHLGTLINCTVLGMVLIAATRLAEPFLLWHEWFPGNWIESVARLLENRQWVLTGLSLDQPDVWIRSADNLISILAIALFTYLYSATGGLRSVVLTDTVQFGIAIVGTLAYAIILLHHTGGIAELPARLELQYGRLATERLLSWGPTEWNSGILIFCGVLGVQWFAQVNADGTGYLAQRMMACRSERDARQAAVVFSYAQILLRSLIWIPIALSLLVLYPAEGLFQSGEAAESMRVFREQTFALGIKDFLPVGIRGLMLTGMLAALASTLDTHLNWGASYWTHDLYRRGIMQHCLKREPGSRELVWVARISNFILLLLSLWIMTHLQSIQAAWHLTLLFGSGLGVVLILRWIWDRINLWSEIAAAGASLLLAPVLLLLTPDWSEGIRLLVMVGVSTTAVTGVTLLTKPENPAMMERYRERVGPVGFWKDHQGDSKKAVREMKRALLATLFCAASLFLLLYGVGKIITTGTWILPVAWLCCLGGLALIPLWKRYGFQEDLMPCRESRTENT